MLIAALEVAENSGFTLTEVGKPKAGLMPKTTVVPKFATLKLVKKYNNLLVL